MKSVQFHKMWLMSILQTTKNKPVTTKIHGVTYLELLYS